MIVFVPPSAAADVDAAAAVDLVDGAGVVAVDVHRCGVGRACRDRGRRRGRRSNPTEGRPSWCRCRGPTCPRGSARRSASATAAARGLRSRVTARVPSGVIAVDQCAAVGVCGRGVLVPADHWSTLSDQSSRYWAAGTSGTIVVAVRPSLSAVVNVPGCVARIVTSSPLKRASSAVVLTACTRGAACPSRFAVLTAITVRVVGRDRDGHGDASRFRSCSWRCG